MKPDAELQIRHARESDLAEINRVSNHYIASSHVTFDVEPFDAEQRSAWFRGFDVDGRWQLFVAHRGEDFVGFAHSKPFRAKGAYDTSVETTVYLAPDARGRGAGTRLYEVLLDALRKQDVHRALAGIALPNPESVALHERLGFRLVATFDEVGRKFDRYWTVCWYELGLP